MISGVSYENIINSSTIIKIEDPLYSNILLYRQWRFFYSLDKETAPLNITDSQNCGIPDYILLMLYKFETAKILLEDSFGLRNPLKGGFFYKKGAQFIDIYIKNIPREHGIASGLVYDENIKELKNTSYEGKSLRITIHRNLIKKTATPIHELFHIYQYSYVHFNNMWFMEGLARWSQSIMQEKIGKNEDLPKSKKELDSLIHKLHDAEFFWNNLISLSEDKDTFNLPKGLENNSEIYNNKKTGSKFVKLFLENCEQEFSFMQKKYFLRKLDDKSTYINRQEKRAVTNNQHIFNAIIKTVNSLKKEKSKELEDFLHLIYPLSNIVYENFNTEEIQNFMKVLNKYTKDIILEQDGIFYCEYFDIFTGTLSIPQLNFVELDISSNELNCFHILKRLNGSLKFENCNNLTDLNGLRNLLSLDGELILDNLNLEKINDLNELQSLKSLKILNMKELKKINGLNDLLLLKSDLYINNCKKLFIINGFNSLFKVGNINISNTLLDNCNFLSEVFNSNKEFSGAIKITNNKLKDIKFLKKIKNISSSLFLHQNQITSLEGLEDLEYIGASFSISANKIENLIPLSNLKEINGLLALSYNKLKNLNGLNNLKLLKTKKWGNTYFSIKFYENSELIDISALENLMTNDNYLVIYCDDIKQYKIKPKVDSNFHKNILEIHDFKTQKLIPTYSFVQKKYHDYSNFRMTTHNKTLTALFDFENKDAKVLVLSFTGAYGNLGGLFYNKYPLITQDINTHKIFLMDPSHTWYNKGIFPFTSNMDENIKFIKKLIISKKYDKVVCMGSSMGAYFALILGCVLENHIDEVLAFSPQIFMDKVNRNRINDKRW
ncbi:MAG: hypothetical protein ACERKK_07370, partial [Poseidonibacter sp.]|uniref:hypothetical protein n=1 Tax=Poseidonibacter sp. TaxID=2321188 RepID=UPI00359DB9A5